MIVFANTVTQRLKYISGFIGQQTIGKIFDITDSTEKFIEYTGPKINYSDKPVVQGEFWIKPVSLLFETHIAPQQISCFEKDNYKAFFKTEGNFSFDVFAATFYLLSRYEEYLPHQKDLYGRYAHENSLAFKENFLNIPLVNVWLKSFAELLKQKFVIADSHRPSFDYIATYDIDEAYSFKHKGWWRSCGAALKDLIKVRLKNLFLRRKVINNRISDPFDSYTWIDTLNRQHGLAAIYFFLVPAKISKYDRNILPAEKALQTIIKEHAAKYKIGVHPSWQSGDKPSLIQEEKERIETITASRITASRQHYIRFNLPQTYRYLKDAGISQDFSMGYGSINGFRASVASPFYWYDLEMETTTNLLLYPFCFMEANSFYEQKFNTAQALEEMRHYYKIIKEVDGTLVTIWHNTFLGTDKKFKGWREVYEQFLCEIL